MAKKTRRYPSDLTDEEWEVVAPLMPKPGRRSRSREVEFREVINALHYLVRSGCGWRMLPIHFSHWRTVYGWFRELEPEATPETEAKPIRLGNTEDCVNNRAIAANVKGRLSLRDVPNTYWLKA